MPNGWKNYETWEMSMILNGGYGEDFYRLVCDFMKRYKGRSPYRDFIRYYDLENEYSPSGFKFGDSRLSYGELNFAMREIKGNA